MVCRGSLYCRNTPIPTGINIQWKTKLAPVPTPLPIHLAAPISTSRSSPSWRKSTVSAAPMPNTRSTARLRHCTIIPLGVAGLATAVKRRSSYHWHNASARARTSTAGVGILVSFT